MSAICAVDPSTAVTYKALNVEGLSIAYHFAVEDCLGYISSNMHRFYDEKVAGGKAS